VVEKRLTRRAPHRHSESRKEIVYQTLDDASYEPPGNISAKSGEKKTITKPESSCRVTKITIACTHVDDADDDTKKPAGKKTSAEKRGDEEDFIIRIDPTLYKTVPYQVVAPVTWGIAKGLAQKVLPGTGTVNKWLREDVLMVETITVTVEGYFCEKDHPKITVKEVGRKTKSEKVAEVGKDEKEVKLFDGSPPAKDDKKGGKKKAKKDDQKSNSSENNTSSSKKDESSSEPVLTTKENWFYVGSLMPKFKSAFFVPNYLYPRFVSPNVYEIHIETCAETRVIYIEAYYEAQYKLEFGRGAAFETGEDKEFDWDPFSPFDESVKKFNDEVALWKDTFDSSTSGSFFNVLFKIVKVVKNLFDNYHLTLKQDGPGFRVNPEISGETLEKIGKILTAFSKLRENLDKRKTDGHTNLEFNVGHEVKAKFLEGSIEANWRHREHGGRRVGWYYDIQVNMILVEAEYGIGFCFSPWWTGHLEIKGAGKVTLSAVAKGKMSSDSKDMVAAGWQSSTGKVIAWWQEKVLKKDKEDKLHKDIELDEELTKDIREGIPINLECTPEVSFEIPVFLEELFNLSPKAEGGLEGGGFIGFDSEGPCLRMGLGLKDVGVSIEISALGGWISFTVGPVPIIKAEDWGKNMGKWIDKKFGDITWYEEGQLRLPAPPDWKEKAAKSKKAAKASTA